MADNIEIRTSHNIVVYYTLASPMERVVALILDLVAMGLLTLLASLLFSFLPDNSVIIQMIILVIWSFYHLLFEVFNGGQSPGKMIMKTKVVNLKGLSPTPGEALLRWIGALRHRVISSDEHPG